MLSPTFSAIAVLSISLSIALLAIKEQHDTNIAKDAEIERLDGVLAAKDGLISKERTLADQAAEREQITVNDAREKNAELEKLRDCFDSGKCVLRLRNESPRDSKLPNSAASTSEPAGTDAGYSRRLEQDYLRLADTLGKVEVNYAALQRELTSRSAKDFCQPKQE